MYCTPPELRKARSQHRCTNCGEAIEPGDEYMRWASYDDWKCFTNKMHPECLKSLEDGSDDFEYTLYGGERPDVVTPNASLSGASPLFGEASARSES